MIHYSLRLGESDFAIGLDPACAEFLPAFYPSAREESAVETKDGTHRLEIRRTETGFEFDASSTPGPSMKLALPVPAMLALEQEIERLVITEVEHLIALHGGAVSTPSGACLLLGDSESGKSSTTFQLAELGHRCLCEEITLCDPSSWQVVDYPQTLSLSEGLIADFEASFSIRGRLHRMVGPIIRYEPDRPRQVTAAGGPVRWILLPRFQPGAATELCQLDPEDALADVLGYSFPPTIDAEAHFDRLIDLLEKVEITRFVYSGAASARAALADLFPV